VPISPASLFFVSKPGHLKAKFSLPHRLSLEPIPVPACLILASLPNFSQVLDGRHKDGGFFGLKEAPMVTGKVRN